MKDISEAVASAKIVKVLLEADVVKQCVDWARKRGYWARKFSSISQRSVPDYLFSGDLPCTSERRTLRVRYFAVEFKAPGKTSTDAQVEEQKAMRSAGWWVWECDNVERFKAMVTRYEAWNGGDDGFYQLQTDLEAI